MAPTQPYAIAVDLGGTNLRVAAFNPGFERLETRSQATQVSEGAAAAVEKLCQCVEEMTARRGPPLGVGIAFPGQVDGESGRIRIAANLPGWAGFELRPALTARLPYRIRLEHDSTAATIGEFWRGARAGSDSMAMLTLGTGVGSGIIVNRRVWRGQDGGAPELGHVAVDYKGPACGCGGRGCLETYVSAPGIAALARRHCGEAVVTARRLSELAQAGHRGALAAWDEMATILAAGLAGWINLLDLPLYVIGGGVSRSWPVFESKLRRELEQRSFRYRRGRTRVERSQLEEAGLTGAAALILSPALEDFPGPSALSNA